MGNELIRPEQETSLAQFDEMRKKAETLIKSGFLPKAIDTPEKAVAIALTGRELGIPMMLAFQEINVIQGKPTASAKLQLGLAKRRDPKMDMKVTDDGQTCTVTITRSGTSPVTTSFSMEDAKRMGLAGKDNWMKQPSVMRYCRAVTANLRRTFPDAIGGLYPAEEIAPDVAVDGDGKPVETVAVDGKPAFAKPTPKAETKPEPKVVETTATPVEQASPTPDDQQKEVGGVRYISTKQAQRLHIIAKESGWNGDQFKLKLGEMFPGVTSTKQLRADQYEATCAYFTDMGPGGKVKDTSEVPY